MASPNDLCTLAQVKEWLGLPSTTSPFDATLSRLISAISQAILAYLSRSAIVPRTLSEVYDGQGNQRLVLRNWPVLNVSLLKVWGRQIPPSTNDGGPPNGFVVSPWDGTPPGSMQWIDVYSSFAIITDEFDRGRQAVAVTYQAGYAVNAEPWVIPATPFQVTALQTYGAWASDLGLIFTDTGAAGVAVASGPTTGQYDVAAGVYTFAAADVGRPVAISYGFVPQDINQAAIEICADRAQSRQRIGISSKTLASQETIVYSKEGVISEAMALMLQPYKSVVVPK